jgi:DNA repair protein SbcD/Mre11
MIRFVHTADTHFGVENYGKIDPATGIHSRLLDFEKALNAIVDTAIEQQVDFFLFCGDAYKTTTPTPTQQKLFLKALLRLYQAKIPTVLLVGNHDNPLSFGKAHTLDIFGDLPLDGFHIIEKPEILNLTTQSGAVQIVGIPWPTRTTMAITDKHVCKSASEVTQYISHAVGSIIQSLAQQLDPQVPAVLAGHVTVSTGVFSGSERRAIYGNDPILLPSQLAIAPFDYVALGHLHRYQNLNPHGHPAIVYSGSPERVDFGECDETKGFCVITIENKNTTHHEFIATPTRPFINIECSLQPGSIQTEQLLAHIKRYELAGAILKIKYHVPAQTKDQVNIQTIQQACEAAHYVASITPVTSVIQRERRSDLNVNMAFSDLLGAYLDTKPTLQPRKKELLEKATLLYEQTKIAQDEG